MSDLAISANAISAGGLVRARPPEMNEEFEEFKAKLSLRAQKLTKQMGVYSLTSLCQHTPDDLLRERGCGAVLLQEIRSKLSTIGRALASDAAWAASAHYLAVNP